MIWRIFGLLVAIYLLFLASLYIFQDNFMFFPRKYQDTPSSINLANFEEIKLVTADKAEIYGWYKKAEEGKKTLVYFHGNAENLTGSVDFFSNLTKDGAGLFALIYRGYGKSVGKPNEKALYEDAKAAVEYLKTQTAENSVVIIGRSIGTGVAVEMAKNYGLGGLVLISPYTSITDIAANQYKYFPIKQLDLVRNKFDSLSKIKDVTEPLLIIHGEQDTLIPITYAKILYEAANAPKTFVSFPEADHINMDSTKMADEIRKFITEGE